MDRIGRMPRRNIDRQDRQGRQDRQDIPAVYGVGARHRVRCMEGLVPIIHNSYRGFLLSAYKRPVNVVAFTGLDGDPGGNRTPNTQFRRLMLYPLSYRAIHADYTILLIADATQTSNSKTVTMAWYEKKEVGCADHGRRNSSHTSP